MFVQTVFAICLEPSPPFSERRSRNATATTDETGIIGTLIKLDPFQAGAKVMLNVAHAST